MAKTISTLAVKMVGNTQQFELQMVKAGEKVKRLKNETQGATKQLNNLLKPGDLGRIQRGFFNLATAAGTAWSAFAAGQRIREQIERFFEDGTVKAARFTAALREQLKVSEGIKVPVSESDLADQRKLIEETQKHALERARVLADLEGAVARGAAGRGGRANGLLANEVAKLQNDVKQEKDKLAIMEKEAAEQRMTVALDEQRQRLFRWRVEAVMQAERDRIAAIERQKSLEEEIGEIRIRNLRMAATLVSDPAMRAKMEEHALGLEHDRELSALQERLRNETDESARGSLADLIGLANDHFALRRAAVRQAEEQRIAEYNRQTAEMNRDAIEQLVDSNRAFSEDTLRGMATDMRSLRQTMEMRRPKK